MVVNRKKSVYRPVSKVASSLNAAVNTPPNTPTSRKRAAESLSVKSKKVKVEYEEIFNQFKKAHHSEISSIVLSMGTGDAGQLGLGEDHLEKKRPSPIESLTDIVTIRAGGMHNICLSKTGKVYTWGCNDDFALGRKVVEDEESMIPGLVDIPCSSIDETVIDVRAGDSHSAVLTSNGRVFIWGSFRDNNGPIGLLRPFEHVKEPTLIDTDHKSIVSIASGENHFVMLTGEGEILTMGCAEQGQLGRVREVYLQRGGKSGLGMLLSPGVVRVRHNLRFSAIFAGANCTVARATEGGRLHGCGLNNYGQLGVPGNELSVMLLTPMDMFDKTGCEFREVAFGLHHTIAMTTEGRVFVVGRGDYGSLGLGDAESSAVVREVTSIGTVVMVAAGSHVSFAVAKDGGAVSWGCGNSYQLGHGDDEDAREPQVVVGKFVKAMRVLDVSVGGQHVLLRAIPMVVPPSLAEETATVAVPVPEVEAVVNDQENNNGAVAESMEH